MDKLSTIQLSFKCPKAFDELIPCNGNWYCNGCQKLVYDFRGVSEDKIKKALANSNYNMCGMFDADRIRVNSSPSKWYKWASAAMMALGFASSSQSVQAQHKVIDTITIPEPIKPADQHNEIFGVMEVSTEYPGGIEKFQKYIMSNIVPDASCPLGSKIFVTFLVGKDGSVSDVKILRGTISKKMRAQIVSIFEKSRHWKPGIQNGRAVKQQFTMPVVFSEETN